MKAILRKARISPKKANLVSGLVRRMNAVEALNILSFTPKKGAKMLHKTLLSAVSNAENNFAQDRNKLVIKSIIVNEASVFKRWLPVSRGRSHPLLKRNSHITVEVGVDEAGVKEVSISNMSDKKEKVPKPNNVNSSMTKAEAAIKSDQKISEGVVDKKKKSSVPTASREEKPTKASASVHAAASNVSQKRNSK